MAAAIPRALDRDIVIVAAVGNKPESDFISEPASDAGVVAVAAVDKDYNHATFSVEGSDAIMPSLAAPGAEMVATRPGGTYGQAAGTSYSSAVVAGVAALIRAKFPDMPAYEVVHRLTATAVDRGPPGQDKTYGYGVINPLAVLTANVPPGPSRPRWSTMAPSFTAQAGTTPQHTSGTAARPPGSLPATRRWPLVFGIAGMLIVSATAIAAAVVIIRRRRHTSGAPSTIDLP
jgi:subtilisin family serine protease